MFSYIDAHINILSIWLSFIAMLFVDNIIAIMGYVVVDSHALIVTQERKYISFFSRNRNKKNARTRFTVLGKCLYGALLAVVMCVLSIFPINYA